MDGTIIELIIYNIPSFIIGVLVALTGIWINRKLKKKDKIKEQSKDSLKKHKKGLVDVLKEINDTKIRCDKFDLWRTNDYKVEIKGLEGLEEQKIYKQAIQHLKIAYPYIYELWDGSIKKIDGLNDELKKLKKYLSDKISGKFEIEPYSLHSTIWCIIEGVKPSKKIKDSNYLDKFFDGINIIATGKMVDAVSSDDRLLDHINCKEVNVNDVKDFLSNLIKKDKVFRDKLKSFTLGYNELNKTFDDFKNELKSLLQEVEDDEDKLKGECERCSSWVKETS